MAWGRLRAVPGQPLRFAIIGAGIIAPSHARALGEIDDAELRVIADIDADRARQRADQFGVEWSGDIEATVARQDVDAVCVCVPTGFHAKVGGLAARAGKHVVTEKPIDVSLEAADSLIAACREARVKLAVISQMRYSPGMQQLKAALDDGKLGKPFLGQALVHWYRTDAYFASAGWRATWQLDGGGALTNQGVHFVDMLLWLLGDAESVYARCSTAAHDLEVEDVAVAMVNFVSGAQGVIQASTATYPGFMERIELYGTDGSAIVEGGELVLLESKRDRGETEPYGLRLALRERTAPPADEPIHQSYGHAHQLADFVQAVRDDREPIINGEVARRPLELIQAVYRSSREGRVVTLPL
jgi:predicted dehydrogenase